MLAMSNSTFRTNSLCGIPWSSAAMPLKRDMPTVQPIRSMIAEKREWDTLRIETKHSLPPSCWVKVAFDWFPISPLSYTGSLSKVETILKILLTYKAFIGLTQTYTVLKT